MSTANTAYVDVSRHPLSLDQHEAMERVSSLDQLQPEMGNNAIQSPEALRRQREAQARVRANMRAQNSVVAALFPVDTVNVADVPPVEPAPIVAAVAQQPGAAAAQPPPPRDEPDTRIILTIIVIFEWALLALTLTLTVLSWQLPCDEPLPVFMILYMIRCLGMILCYSYLRVRAHYQHRYRLQRQAWQKRVRRLQKQRRRQERPPLTEMELPEAPRPPPLPSYISQQRLIQYKKLLDLFSAVVYLLAAIWILGSQTCSVTSPFAYYGSLGLLIYGLVAYASPLILGLLLLFCLPCVLAVLQRAQSEQQRRLHGTPPQILARLPVFSYDETVSVADRQRYIPVEDATCSICIDAFKRGEAIRRLPCRHCFHSHCVDNWLEMHKTCPLCVQPVDDDDSDDEEGNAQDIATQL